MHFNTINCNGQKCRIHWKPVVYFVNSRLWCSGSTTASQALSEGSIPFSRFELNCSLDGAAQTPGGSADPAGVIRTGRQVCASKTLTETHPTGAILAEFLTGIRLVRQRYIRESASSTRTKRKRVNFGGSYSLACASCLYHGEKWRYPIRGLQKTSLIR